MVGLVLGHITKERYQAYLKKERVRHEIVWSNGKQRHKDELPAAWLEFHDKDGGRISRTTIGTFHPEGFVRLCANIPTLAQVTSMIRERLIDYVNVLTHGVPHLPSFLSSMNFHWNTGSSLIIPVSEIDAFTLDNDNISDYLRHPLLKTNRMNDLIKKSPVLNAKMDEISKTRRKACIVQSEAVAYWERSGRRAEYGGHATTYAKMAARYAAACAYRDEWKKIQRSNMSADQRKDYRAHVNGLERAKKDERKKKTSEMQSDSRGQE
jgi:hypothetical protein